jgi:hypothetical protein
MRRLLAALSAAGAALAVVLATSASTPAHPLTRAAACPIFPKDNPWNQRVDRLPVDRRSSAYVGSIGASAHFHADFGSGRYAGGPIGIPFDVVTKATHRSHVSFDYSGESDHVGYPIPKGVHIEGGTHASGDRHAILVDRSSCRLYELDALHHTARGWHAGSGAVWNLRSNHLRPKTWTSADAAGLPILPGLARWDDVRKGSIDHALRVTVPRTRTAFVYPARHAAGDSGNPSLPPMGLRIRLKKGVSLRGLSKQARIVAVALKRYGAIVADNGSAWYFSGAPSSHWNNDQLHQLDRLSGRDFEVVNTASLPHPGR